MVLSITVKEITFWNGNLVYVIRNVSFTFVFKKLLENALRFVTDVVLNILPYTADFTRVDVPTADCSHRRAGSVTRNAFKYKLTGFRINFFKNDFSVYYFVFVFS